MTEKNIGKEDFDFTLKYNIFDVLYSVNKGMSDLDVKSWCVIGYELNSSSDKRCFDYILCSYPISIYIHSNKRIYLDDLLLRAFVGTTKTAVITEASEDLRSRFDYLLELLSANN